MTSVESAVPVKTPEPDQYWEHVKSKDRVYFIGRNPEGEMVWQCEGDTVEVGNLDWSDWQHIPGCTGWDWEFEAFPHYYVGTKWCDGTAYVVRESPTKSHAVGRSGNVFNYDWDDAAKRFVASGTLVRITEAEAMARMDKPAEQWPRYYVCDTWFSHAYITRDSDGMLTSYFNDGKRDCRIRYWDEADDMNVDRGSFREVTEAEALARVKPVETWPKYYVRTSGADSWVYRADGRYTIRNLTCDCVADPAEWYWNHGNMVEITESEALARVVKPTEPDSDPPPFAKPFTNPRSGMGIRKDIHPDDIPINPVPGKVVATVTISWRPTRSPYNVAADVTYSTDDPLGTPVESPDGWVVQDRVPARPGIDQGWWAYKGDAVDPSGSSWWDFQSTDIAAGKEHGYPHIEGYVLHLRCRRKDLPAVPAPIEETFPQWYMLKESEVHQAFTPWAIKRTGEETSIRYAYDGGDKLLASNETWYGATDVWRQCHSAEAFQRLGILGEAYLPAVPADKRRVPIKAWVTYRLADEGGDWPVRATPADQTYLNWKEIKFDSNGMFIEVDQ